MTDKLSGTWKATVRNIIYTHSSDSEAFVSGNKDIFRHMGKGIWGIRNEYLQELKRAFPELWDVIEQSTKDSTHDNKKGPS
jgi:hypothetical protein